MISQTLIAFTIEFDNAWELQFWTKTNPAPFRTSMVMWANFLRFVGQEGITVRNLSEKAGYEKGKSHPSLAGMIRWRYVTIEPPIGKKGKSSKLDYVTHLTSIGSQAAEAWKPLANEIEIRWETRFGKAQVIRLKESLARIISSFRIQLPHYIPVLNHLDGMRVLTPFNPESDPPDKLALPFLLSQVLHMFTLTVEQNSEISLALWANVLRILNSDGYELRELPQRSGISKEALAMSINFLRKRGYLEEAPSPKGRGKIIKLTEKGFVEQSRYSTILDAVEKEWEKAYLFDIIVELRSSLDPFLNHTPDLDSPLFQGLDPDPELWRANRPRPKVLPHHPMVLHRGGWPDGS